MFLGLPDPLDRGTDYGSTGLYKCVPVTGMFFSESGLVHPNYTEVHLPDIQAEAMDVMSKYVFCMYTL
jgi:hypothetical protein